MPLFLDVNVWLPMLWQGHAASGVVHRWVEDQSEEFILCRVVQLALLRHLTNPAIMGDDVFSNEAASSVLVALGRQSGIVLHAEPPEIDTLFPRLGEDRRPRRNRWTDAYLAAFAIAGNFKLVSFDRDFARYEDQGLRWERLEMGG